MWIRKREEKKMGGEVVYTDTVRIATLNYPTRNREGLRREAIKSYHEGSCRLGGVDD
jgi:hypothetical protein